jgi:hypothetical protein
VYGPTHPTTTTRRADRQLSGRVGIQSRHRVLRADQRRAAVPTATVTAQNTTPAATTAAATAATAGVRIDHL